MSLHEWVSLTPDGRDEWLNESRDRWFKAPESRHPDAPPNTRFEIPGHLIVDVSSFLCAVGEAVNGPHGYFGVTLFAFDDCCLWGGFGASRPSTFGWRCFEQSQQALGHRALREWAEEKLLAESYPDEEGKQWLEQTVDNAGQGNGETLFDIIVEGMTHAGWTVELRNCEGRLECTLAPE